MKKVLLTFALLVFCFVAIGQTDKKPTLISETVYILPKTGMSTQFENAIAQHNNKFHPVGSHHAVLRRVEYGDRAGWYVWVMRGTYASLDSRPTSDKGHDDDWNKTVDPTVERYGNIGLWAYDEKLSTGVDIFKKSNKYIVWAVDVKRGKSKEFKALIEKLRATYETMNNRAFLVYTNQIHTAKSFDVALLWNLDKYADLDVDWKTKEAHEKLNGVGSWEKMVEEWMTITEDHTVEIRTKL
ncbi:hypothetical protein [Bizionia paragorgiae]|uniref:hypothetical protein n=1 Tax=Bizionia paragorgiae TaxID=283786 RepID=UPI003A95679B